MIFSTPPVLAHLPPCNAGLASPLPLTGHMRIRLQVKISLAAVFGFMALAWPALIYYTGWWGFVKFWVAPWLGYHFWMSTFTVIHHTAPHIPFKPAEQWDAAKAQLSGTVHCDFPRWWVCPSACAAGTAGGCSSARACTTGSCGCWWAAPLTGLVRLPNPDRGSLAAPAAPAGRHCAEAHQRLAAQVGCKRG